MSFGLAMGQMASAFNGAHGAMEKMGKANLANEDIKNKRDEIAYQKGLQDHEKQERQRKIDLRDALSKIPTQVEDGMDAEGNPKMRQTRLDEQLGAAAEAYRTAGDFDQYVRHIETRDKVGFDRATKEFERFDVQSDGMGVADYINGISSIFTGDPFAGKIENVKANPDGSVTFDAVNGSTGQRVSRTAKTLDEARSKMRQYYSPETFAKLRDSRAASIEAMRAEWMKPRVLKPGDQLQVFDPDTGVFKAVGAGLDPSVLEAEKARLRGQPSGGGSGSGGDRTPGTISMTSVDRTLQPFFMKSDPANGREEDPDAYLLVRQLAPRMPLARNGDSEGAAVQAMAFYQRMLKENNGNKEATREAIEKAVAQNAQSNAAPATAPAAPANTPPPPKPSPKPIQLLAPFYGLSRWREDMQKQTNDSIDGN
jgi:hypothetical protein